MLDAGRRRWPTLTQSWCEAYGITLNPDPRPLPMPPRCIGQAAVLKRALPPHLSCRPHADLPLWRVAIP
jgi:hypothetical protein